jgi:GNAT superfamily N-acetyltransferase
MTCRVSEYSDGFRESLVPLVAELRLHLDGEDRATSPADVESAGVDLDDHLASGHRVFFAGDDDHHMLGYMVLKIIDGVTWVESLYVRPSSRRLGTGSRLFDVADDTARTLGHDTAYVWVHPDNNQMISFLRKRGYDHLNLIEIRRSHSGEEPSRTVELMDNSFRY